MECNHPHIYLFLPLVSSVKQWYYRVKETFLIICIEKNDRMNKEEAAIMELRQLATFRMIAHTLSFSRAAVALNYVQSSVTAQIQTLEEELGIQLFDRLGKRVAL